MKALLTVSTAVLMVGCATQPRFVKAYSGQEVPHEQVALLKPTHAVVIESIDGAFARDTRTALALTSVEIEVALLPGQHVVIAGYDNGYAGSTRPIELKFEARAGHRYLLRRNAQGGQWNPEIIDVTGREECWNMGTMLNDPC